MRPWILALTVGFLPGASRGDDVKPAFPGADWQRIPKPESEGYSSARLEALRVWMKTQDSTAMMVAVGGRVLFEYGDLKLVSRVASIRKSILGIIYGKYVFDGSIDLNKTVKQIGLDDVQKFLPIEENATLEMLLAARSGIYHPDGPPDPPTEACPPRGSQYPGTTFCYTNWDFNAAGTAFEKLTGKNIYDALEQDLARPIGMQDFDRARQKKDSVLPYSVHPEYHMDLSTRDMARIGLLMSRGGNWNGTQIINSNWVRYLTALVTPVSDLLPRNFRFAAEQGPSRWGFGSMWWVWDSPRFPGGVHVGDFDRAYTANGWGGQFITVLPSLDMVVAHKVNIPSDKSVNNVEFQTILQMLLASRCRGQCRS